MIRKAVTQDIPPTKKYRSLCSTHDCPGIFQWNEHYPDLAVLTKDVNEETVYVVEAQERLLAVLCSPW